MDYLAFSYLTKEKALKIIGGVKKACDLANVFFVGGETAVMQSFYEPGDFDIAGFATGIIKKQRSMPIKEGDYLIGLKSSGPHSNGFTVLRSLLYSQMDNWLGWLMQPTKIYTEVIEHFDNIKALAHITGGGFYNKLPRIIPSGYVAKLFKQHKTAIDPWTVLEYIGNWNRDFMFSNFNCGIGMVLIVDKNFPYKKYFGDDSSLIGVIEKNDYKSVRWEDENNP